ncbi:MAG: hypothetical protein IJJ23_04595 [Clostridia bacterium]|nr:hypothetical protein [Clostridia bacterium]
MTVSANAESRAQSRFTLPRGTLCLLVACLVCLAVGLGVIGARMGAISRNARRIDTLNQMITAERSRRQQLEIALNERSNIDMIRDAAIYRLGMSEPESAVTQVVALPELTPSDVVTVYEPAQQPLP